MVELARSGLFGVLNSPVFGEEGVIRRLALCSVSKSEDFRKSCTISCAGEKATVFLTVLGDRRFFLVNEKQGLLVPS